jgi:hypothetical protein
MNHRNHLRSSFYHQKWASITLRSPMQSPFDHPSINFDHPSSITPRPPTMIEAPSRAFSPRLPPRCAGATQRQNPPDRPDNQTTVDKQHDRSPARLTCGRGRLERSHYPIMRVDSQCRAFFPIDARTIARSSARVSQRVFMLACYQRSPNSKTNPRASQRLVGCRRNAPPPHSPTKAVANARLCISTQHGEQQNHGAKPRSEHLYARALSRPLALLEGKTRARPGDRTVAKPKPQARWKPNSLLGRGKKTRGWVGVARNSGEPAIIDVTLLHSAVLFQNLGGPSLKNPGRPEKPSSLTQGSHRIRQIELAATGERAGAKAHQRRSWSHGGACRYD